jgi:hypothetical protein
VVFLLDHMWQSLQVFGCLAVFAFLTRRNPARFRLWLWRVAAMKLVIPFALLERVGSAFPFPLHHSSQPIPTPLVHLIDGVAPWFVPGKNLTGWWFGMSFVLLAAGMLGAAAWARGMMRVEAPRVADEAARLEKDPDDRERGVGFLDAALISSWALLCFAAPLISGSIERRLRLQALLRENETSLEHAAIEIKPAAPGMGARMRVTVDAGGVTIRNATLQEIGAVAYGVTRFAVYGTHFFVEGEEDWLTGSRYDMRINGRVIEPDDLDTAALHRPVTRFLATRFGVEIHLNGKCQPPCGKWGSYVLPATAVEDSRVTQ